MNHLHLDQYEELRQRVKDKTKVLQDFTTTANLPLVIALTALEEALKYLGVQVLDR